MFERGFKSWCEEVSVQIRRELKLLPTSPLSPPRFAELLGVRLLMPNQLSELPKEVCARLTSVHSDCWSAITIAAGKRSLIIYNPDHSPARQASDLMHEMAHMLLNHEPSRVFITPKSGAALRTHDPNQEQEANWLCGCLLLPRPALVAIRRLGLSDQEACSRFGVSRDMLRFRINVTGVDRQVDRYRRSRR
jgi:hypothetical protein